MRRVLFYLHFIMSESDVVYEKLHYLYLTTYYTINVITNLLLNTKDYLPTNQCSYNLVKIKYHRVVCKNKITSRLGGE